MVIHSEKFPYLSNFIVKLDREYWSIEDLFQNIRNFYEIDYTNDPFLRNLRLDKMKELINDERFCPITIGWFSLQICQVRQDIPTTKELFAIVAKNSLRHSSIEN